MADSIYLKVLGPDRAAINGGSGRWPEPGVWTAPVSPVIPCKAGWHVCTPTQILEWLPSTTNDLWIAEIDGETIDDGDKLVAERARLVRRLDWCDRTARPFAADCAESVLPLFEAVYPDDRRPREAIETARRLAAGEATADELDAARDAAWDAGAAARDAAWDAAGAAAWAAGDAAWAAEDAARATAWAAEDAARAAAWDAAEDAPGLAAAGAAAREQQARMLLRRIDPEHSR